MTGKQINNKPALIITVAILSIFQVIVLRAATDTVKNAPAKKEGKATVTISATVDKPKITIGDKIKYTVTISHRKKISVSIPDIADTLRQFELKDYEVLDPKRRRGKLVHEFRYLITTFTTGEFKIEPFTVKWLGKDGEKKEAKSGEISIFVESVKSSESDKDDIRDIKSPVNVKHSWLFWFLWFGVPLLILTGGSIFYFTRKVKESGFFGAKEPAKPADELAYDRLEKLRNMNLIEKGEIKQHYIILSEIVRKYMKKRYRITVLDMTTYELCQQLRVIGTDKKHTSIIKNFLDECDMVKFARYRPEEKMAGEDFGKAREIVDITKSGLEKAELVQERTVEGQVKS